MTHSCPTRRSCDLRRRNPLSPDRPEELYGFAARFYVRSVRLALEEKRLPYTLHEVDPFQPGGPPDWYLALHPFGEIPALRDGDLVLFESDAIQIGRAHV